MESSEQSEEEYYLKEKQKYALHQIMNDIYYECHNIDLYSINELERIISFSLFDKRKVINFIENYNKEEIMKQIEEYDIKCTISKPNKGKEIMTLTTPPLILPKKEVLQIIIKKFPSPNSEDQHLCHEQCWSFISNNVNVIDMQDFLHSYDHHKLINKAKTIIKDKDTYKLNEYFEKFYENREKKFKELFRANLEDNDIKFIDGDEKFMDYVIKKNKKTFMNNISENLIKNPNSLMKFSKFYDNIGDFAKEQIYEYLDIFSLGKFGLTDKKMFHHIFKKYGLEKIAKNYCLSIFRNTGTYLNDQDKLKDSYKNYMSMLIYRPRIRYAGVYYSRVRYTKVGDYYGFSDQVINTISYYRIYRFFPNGEIYSLTTPFIKSNKIINAVHRNLIEMKRGRFFIDFDDSLTIELANSKDKSSFIYRYKVNIFYLQSIR
jgi:hypothetical protein